MLFISGYFTSYVAGFFKFFRAVSVYLVLDDDHPIIRLIFQKSENEIQNFIVGSFHFEILQVLNDSCVYRVRLGNFSAIVYF